MAQSTTKLPLSLKASDRELIESVAQLKGQTLTGWIRSAALEASQREVAERCQRGGRALSEDDT